MRAGTTRSGVPGRASVCIPTVSFIASSILAVSSPAAYGTCCGLACIFIPGLSPRVFWYWGLGPALQCCKCRHCFRMHGSPPSSRTRSISKWQGHTLESMRRGRKSIVRTPLLLLHGIGARVLTWLSMIFLPEAQEPQDALCPATANGCNFWKDVLPRMVS